MIDIPTQIVFRVTPRTEELINVFIGTSTTLYVLSFVMVTARIYLRVRYRLPLQVADYFVLFGFILATAILAMILAPIAIHARLTPASISFEQMSYAYRLAIFTIPLWAAAMASVKISVACMLLRFLNTYRWRVFLYFMIGLQVCYGLLGIIFSFVRCRKLSANWKLGPQHPSDHCFPHQVELVCSSAASAVCIATDIIFSLLPITFVRRMERPLRERLLVCSLMAVGLFASTASIVRTVQFMGYPNLTADTMVDWGLSIITWMCAEIYVAIIAASMPYFKAPIESLLLRFRVKVDDALGGTPTVVEISASQLERYPRAPSPPLWVYKGEQDEEGGIGGYDAESETHEGGEPSRKTESEEDKNNDLPKERALSGETYVNSTIMEMSKPSSFASTTFTADVNGTKDIS